MLGTPYNEDVIKRGQAVALAAMRDTCVVTRRVGRLATDPVTGATSATTDTVYDGRCRIRNTDAMGVDESMAGVVLRVVPRQIVFPADLLLKPGDVCEITASENPAMVGVKVKLAEVTARTFTTAQRWNVKEIT